MIEAEVRNEEVHIFLGTEPKTEIARKVLQCSIDRRTSAKVKYVPMIGPEWEYDHSKFHVGTGFSLRRWMIPAYCDWKGRAIYLDSDQLVFSDIWDLWTKPDQHPSPRCAAWMTRQPSKFSNVPHPHSSVMVIDCDAARDQRYFSLRGAMEFLTANDNKRAYGELMFPNWMRPSPGQLGVEWNSLNVYAKGKTKLLHYTQEPSQPWYKPDHVLSHLWKTEFQIAYKLGYILLDEIKEAVAKYGVKEDWRPTNGLHPSYLKLIEKT